MKKILSIIFALLIASSAMPQIKTSPLFVDDHGVMRRTATGEEVAYYGVNYTLPFAHSYRAASYLGADRFEAINQDVYHFARLGFNAFRLHLWDVELSDAQGNLVDNDHLRTLDYLIKKLEERGIDIVLTTQTNFGNGYPERNIITDGFTYKYDKCTVHSIPEAVAAQQNYIKQLAMHTNTYTGRTYAEDTCIVAFEINNEPCHSVSKDDTRDYITKMVDALKSTGFNKTILYNVSHNHDFVEAYFQSPIDGGTYQWYPTGLVSGHKQKLNFLPYTDNYYIDFKDVPGFESRAKVIYEFDPADITASYLYPAVIRTFRSAGFQWVTQFAYDATFLACYNTDYQTHYLNIFYTPGKAVGMKIAGEVVKEVPMYAQFPKYPNDTVFMNTTVSYKRDLALYNNGTKYFYTNNCDVPPTNPQKLREICGVGSSPIVKYSGTGIYFADKIADGVWRFEVMPDHVEVADPFEKPSLSRKVGVIINSYNNMTIDIPDLGKGFSVENVSRDADCKRNGDTLSIKPGVYILRSKKAKISNINNLTYNHIRATEFYAPSTNVDKVYLVHNAAPYLEEGKELELTATIVAPAPIDSVVVLPSTVSFWKDYNPSTRMTYSGKYSYKCTIPRNWLWKGGFGYYIVVYSGGSCQTFPSGLKGMPLDWDYENYNSYYTQVVAPESPVLLITSAADDSEVNAKVFPSWGDSWIRKLNNMPFSTNGMLLTCYGGKDSLRAIIYKDITAITKSRGHIADTKTLKIKLLPAEQDITITAGFVDEDGITFAKKINVAAGQELVSIPLSELSLSPTFFLRETYPTFCAQKFEPEGNFALKPSQLSVFEIVSEPSTQTFTIGLVGVWME